MKYCLLWLWFLCSGLSVYAQNSASRARHFNLSKGLALQGYDPVAYFVQHKAVKGSSRYAVLYQGVTYYCSSMANKELLLRNAAAYEPQYGGWCAYAMGDDGSKVSVDPETFKIIDGKLYLFYNSFFKNTLKSWNKNEAELKKKADQHWIKLLK